MFYDRGLLGVLPLVATYEHARRWLQFTANLGRARNTVEAYGRALDDHLRFCASVGADPRTLRPDVIAEWIGDQHARPNRFGMQVRHLDLSCRSIQRHHTATDRRGQVVFTSTSSRTVYANATRFAEVKRDGGVGRQSEVLSAALSGLPGYPTSWRGHASSRPAGPKRSGT